MEPSGVATSSKSQEVMEAQRRFVSPCAKPLYDEPLVLVEGEGVRVKDADGREYLDL